MCAHTINNNDSLKLNDEAVILIDSNPSLIIIITRKFWKT